MKTKVVMQHFIHSKTSTFTSYEIHQHNALTASCVQLERGFPTLASSFEYPK